MSTPVRQASAPCFVEASAGTGKTHLLVNEIASAIEAGVPVDRIAAVTFTHAAAGNMKVRVRQELERRGNQGEALRTLDRAFIGTIHGFCASLLRLRPVEARVDPAFTELDEPNARMLFDRVFHGWLAGKLNDPGPVLRRALVRLSWSEDRDAYSPVAKLAEAARNLAAWRDYTAEWEIRDIDRENRLRELFKPLTRLTKLLQTCARRSDSLERCLRPAVEAEQRIRKTIDAGTTDFDEIENELLSIPSQVKYFDSNKGSGFWAKGVERATVIAAWEQLRDEIESFRKQADADLSARLRPVLWEAVELYQTEKERAGALDFEDLLICARNLLRNPDARRDLQERFDRIFIDEFQDTDPLQTEILLSLCGNDASSQREKLLVVGDPKQSIYRFRRADAREYRRVRENLLGETKPTYLDYGRRSTAALHQFVNAAFANMPDALDLQGGEPASESQPSVIALPIPELHGRKNLSAKKADEVAPETTAAFVDWLLKSGMNVRRGRSGERGPIRPEDICILFRKTFSWGQDLTQEYVRALEARGIEHVLAGSKSFHKREEINTIRAALHAIEWPEDELAVYAVLRGALFFIPDSDLFHFRSEHGRYSPFFDAPDDLDPRFRPVVDVLSLLRKLHHNRNRRTPSETITELLDHARAHIGLAFHTGGERRLANVFRLCDIARAFEASRPGSFRSFVDYLDEEFETGEQSEAAVLEQQSGGVQLMTVHKAKGLEFPVVILAHMTTRATRDDGSERYVEKDLCAQKLCGWAPWELIDNAEQEGAEDLAEAVRIAYVAATRAMDMLVVSAAGCGPWKESWLTPLYSALYPHPDRWTKPESYPHVPVTGRMTVRDFPDPHQASAVWPGMHVAQTGNRVFWFDPKALPAKPAPASGLLRGDMLNGTEAQRQEGFTQWQHWVEERDALIHTGKQPALQPVLASKAKPGSELDDIEVEIVSLDAPDGQRPATRVFGRIVHKLLEAWDPARIDQLAMLYAARENASEAEATAAAAVVKQAMQHPVLQQASNATTLLREYPVAVTLSTGELIEGTLDLAWSDGTSWTVLDYKTGTAEPQGKTQVRLYALALQRATGLPARAILLEV